MGKVTGLASPACSDVAPPPLGPCVSQLLSCVGRRATCTGRTVRMDVWDIAVRSFVLLGGLSRLLCVCLCGPGSLFKCGTLAAGLRCRRRSTNA